MKKTIPGFVICLALAGIAAARQSAPPQETFADRLLKNRYQLNLQHGKLSGPALPVLQSALSGAQFVLIGEDHGISQIPQFAGAVCEMVGPQGFHTLAVEAGPLAARELRPWIERDDGPAQLVEFEKKYPETIAFYNFQEEYDSLRHCARSAQGGKFQLWGLDHELMGDTG